MEKFDCRGVAGPFEDLPALLIILIAISIFLTSAVYAYSSYYERHEVQEPEEICWTILKSVRSYNEFRDDGGVEGDFSFDKLWGFFNLDSEIKNEFGDFRIDDEEIREKLVRDFHISSKYDMYIIILDKSNYDSNILNIYFNINVGPDNVENEYYLSKSAPITISINNLEIHTGELIVGIGWNE